MVVDVFRNVLYFKVNGREVGRDARVLQEELQAASGNIVLKILPSYHEAIMPRQVTLTLHHPLSCWCCAL